MSEDKSSGTSRGHLQQQLNTTENDPNSSIIGKMRSRVTNILPQTLSKWFSPVSGEEGNRNGSLRRRRDEMQQNDTMMKGDDDGTTDDGGGGGGRGIAEDTDDDDDDAGISLPPPKKSKLNTTEEYLIKNPYVASSSRTATGMSLRNLDYQSISTPTTPSNRKRHLNLIKTDKDPPYIFSNASTIAETTKRRQLSHHMYSNMDEPRYIDEDVPDTDVLEVIPEHNEPTWNNRTMITSRRSLNIPSSVRRQTVLNRSTEHSSSSSVNRIIDNDQDNEDEEELRDAEAVDDNNSESGDVVKENSKRMVLTNGKISNVIQGGGDTESESGDSQCSSNLLMQRQKLSSRLFGTGSKSSLNRSNASRNVGLNFYTHLEGKKSLFSDKNMNMTNALNNSTISLTSLNRRQSFNVSLYGSTSALSDSRLLNISSPFYKGRTTYGGASAYSKYSQQHPVSSIRISRTPTSIRPSSSLSSLSSSNNSFGQAGGGGDIAAPISSTAKRILELMNQFTTPLSDAKKMANTIKVPSLVDHKKRFNDDDLKQSRAIRMNAPKTPYSRPGTKLLAPPLPPTNELQVPSMANLLQMKKLQNNMEKVREIANASKSNLNTKEEYKLPSSVTQNVDSNKSGNTDINCSISNNSSNNKHINKIRTKMTSTRQSAKNVNEEETMPSVNLPNIPLPLMKSVPKIDIDISKPSHQEQQQSTLTTSISQTLTTTAFSFSSLTNSSKSESYSNCNTLSTLLPQSSSSQMNQTITKQNLEFKFSMPVAVNTTNVIQDVNAESVEKFIFSKPIILDMSATETVMKPQSQSSAFENFKFRALSENALTKPENTQNIEVKPSSSPSLLPSVVPQLKTGSVLDALKNQAPATANSCTKSNEKAIEKPDSESIGFGEKFKMSTNKWECSVCMIQNDNKLEKCAACETPKKKLESSINSASNSMKFGATADKFTSKNSFFDMFKPKSDSWECPECMIVNNNELKECLACKASKPGDKLSSVSSSVPKEISTTTTTIKDACFNKLVSQQSSKWECPACLTYNDQIRSKCACCEQEKPGSKPNQDALKSNIFGSSTSNSKFTFGFSAMQKEEDLKKDSEKNMAVTSSSNKEKEKSAINEKKNFSFGSSSVVSSSTLSTIKDNNNSQPPIMFGFKPLVSNKNDAGKDVPDVSSSSFKFGIASTQSSTGNTQETQNNGGSSGMKLITPTTNSGTTFKFGNLINTKSDKEDQKTIESKSDTSTEITKTVKPIVGSFSNLENVEKNQANIATSSNTITSNIFTIQKPDSTEDSKNLFKFGPNANKNVQNEGGKKLNFNFSGSSDATTTSKPSLLSAFSSPITQKESSTDTGLNKTVFGTQPTTSTTTSPSTFNFIKPSIPGISGVSPFGAGNSSISVTSTNTTTNVPTFGSLATTTNSSSTLECASNTNTKQSPAVFGSPSALSQQQTGVFGSNFSSFSNAGNNSQLQSSGSSPSSNLFAFGSSTAKTESSGSIFGSVSSTTTSKQFNFGSTPTTTASSAAPFLFGAGASSTTLTTQKSESTPAPIFGFSTSSGTNSGTQQQQQQSEIKSAFGQPSNISANPFGSSNISNTPSFGNSQSGNSATTFGSTTPTFGSTGFGANNSTFGSSSAAAATASSFGSVIKKPEPVSAYNFSSTAQTTQPGVFTFGASSNDAQQQQQQQQPFNFSANSAPSFNFTGSQEATPFQFGAVPMKPTFNFSGIETTSNAPFQFSAAGVNPANIFAPTPTPGLSSTAAQQAARRKIRPRRTQQR